MIITSLVFNRCHSNFAKSKFRPSVSHRRTLLIRGDQRFEKQINNQSVYKDRKSRISAMGTNYLE
ncbi:Uncharacterised protein [uncultured archaeon]|nr:Uncharacterised protein [uncultured archaeon]